MKLRRELYYDANFSVENYRGMGKYINNFAKVLSKKFDLKAIGLLTGNKIAINNNYLPFGFSNYIFWEQISLPKKLLKTNAIFIFPYNTAPILLSKRVTNVLFLHDLIFLKSSSTKSLKQKIGKMYRSFIVPKIVKQFKYIITVSEYSKREIIETFKIPAATVDVIPNSVNFTEAQIKDNPGFHSREKFFFHIGGEPDYKNSKSTLFAFAGLPPNIKENHCLKIIGIRDPGTLADYQDTAKSLGIDKNVIFLSYQSDDEIKDLYKKAKLFIFSSLEEGFGIPIIEAFKFGCPVVCSNLSCLPEVAKDAAHYYNPSVTNALKDKILEVLTSYDLVEAKINQGYKRALAFSYLNFENEVVKWFNKLCATEQVDFLEN